MTTISLTTLDEVVIVLFVAAVLALGFSARLKQNSVLQFIAAGRSLTLPVFVATLVTTWYGGILGVGEAVTFYGFGTWLLLGIPYYAFALIYALYFAERVRNADQITLPERLALRWGNGVGVLGGGLVFLLAVPAAHVLMLGVLVQTLTGWSPTCSILVATLGGTLFLYKGGLLADVRVGMLAFVMMYVGFAVMLGWCLLHYPLGPTLDKIPNKSLLTFAGGNGPIVIFSFFVLGAWTLVDPGFHQRVASTATPATGKRGVFVSVFFWFLFDMLTVGTGMYALALLPKTPENPLEIFPRFGDQVLPPGLKAVFICGMLGTILSAMVGYTLVSGSTLGREIVARLRAGMTDAAVTLWSRIGIFVACVVAILLALRIHSVVSLWYAWGGCVIGALLIPISLAYLKTDVARLRPAWMAASMALAFLVSFAWLLYAYQTNNEALNVSLIRDRGSLQLLLPGAADAMKLAPTNRTDVSIGTLVPALVISGCVTGIGAIVGRRERTG